MIRILKKACPFGLILALPLILYAPFLFGSKVLYWGTYLLQFFPWRQLAVKQVRAGHWPLWNPYLGAGAPLAANLQTAAFYPPNVLFLLMPVERAFGWVLALHIALAGLSAYYLGRTLGLSRFGALVTGLAYSGGGYLVARWVFPSMVYAAAWLPLMLALTERLIKRTISNTRAIRYWVLDIALLALTVGLQLLAGHAQTSFYSALIVAAFALARITPYASRITRRLFRSAGSLLLAALWGLGLAAIQLLPSAELAAHSQRAGGLSDLQFAFELSFWPWRLISLVAPNFFGNPARGEYWAFGTYWEETAYLAILPLLLAGLAVAAWGRKRGEEDRGPLSLVPFLLLLAALSVLLALGEHTPLYPLLFHYVPGFGLFQAPARLMIGYALAVPLLAGIGADAFRPTVRARTACRILLLAGLGIGIAGLVARLALPMLRPSLGSSTARLGLTLAVAGGVLLLRAGGTARRLGTDRWQALVVGVVALDLLAFGLGLAPGAEPQIYHTPVASAQFLEARPPGRIFVAHPYAREVYDRYVSLDSFGPSDVAYLQGLRESLIPNLNAAHHLPGVGNYDPLTVDVYRDLWDHLEGERDDPPEFDEIRPLLDLFGARYIITDDALPLPLLYDAGPNIYLNKDALPAAFVVSRARVVADPEARLAALLDPAFDPREEVILGAASPDGQAVEGDTTSQPLPTILRQGPDRVMIQVEMSQPGFLVLTDTYYPGWQATVDGEPAKIQAANHAFRAVELSPGDHTVVFRYAPLSFRLGAGITLGAALLLGAVALLLGVRTPAAGTDERESQGGSCGAQSEPAKEERGKVCGD